MPLCFWFRLELKVETNPRRELIKKTAPTAVIRTNELQQHIDLLADMRSIHHPVVSVFLDLGQETGELARFVRRRIAACANTMPVGLRARLHACGESVIEQLFDDQVSHARGLAVFVTGDGAAPLITAMPFAVPFRNGLTVSSSPDIFPLLQLNETLRPGSNAMASHRRLSRSLTTAP